MKEDITSFQKYSSFLRLCIVNWKIHVSFNNPSSYWVFFPRKLASEVWEELLLFPTDFAIGFVSSRADLNRWTLVSSFGSARNSSCSSKVRDMRVPRHLHGTAAVDELKSRGHKAFDSKAVQGTAVPCRLHSVSRCPFGRRISGSGPTMFLGMHGAYARHEKSCCTALTEEVLFIPLILSDRNKYVLDVEIQVKKRFASSLRPIFFFKHKIPRAR